jgi:uncharacterized protein with HEPN domain
MRRDALYLADIFEAADAVAEFVACPLPAIAFEAFVVQGLQEFQE